MDSERWRKVERLYHLALDQEESQRAAFVAQACAGDESLQRELGLLLERARETDNFLEAPALEVAARALAASHESEAGAMIGSYRLLEAIGEGGMGQLWLAEQQQPVRRRVALKLIKAGMDTREVVTRFESERQALALMDHPAIAKVFDAGSTLQGRPYFVMEYVPGVKITEHCDKHHLTTRERLDLMIQVCEGVQHAHQKAIIHRDLKPSNVLVSIQNGNAMAKIIDFGVAKATAQPLTDKTLFTRFGAMIGTPEYMSPEQADLTAQDVDTRTDVYSLGVILYELLVGALPFDRRKLLQAGSDVGRQILQEAPVRPSTRIRTLGEGSSVSARNRSTDPAALARQLKGDLDWITLKAMEKDRTRRYGSPSELAADLRRHLSNEPVLACPPSLAYRAGKFVQRHRSAVAAAAIAAVFLVGFSGAMAVQAQRIAHERDRANQEARASQRVTEFLTGLFRVSDPSEARGNSVTAREILDKGANRIVQELKSQPVIQARLMDAIGEVYTNLGLYDRARPLLENALVIRRRVDGNEHIEVADSLERLGLLDFLTGDFPTSERLLRQALATRRKLLGDEHLAVTQSLSSLGALLRQKETQKDVDEAERDYREALSTRRKLLGGDDPAIAQSLNNLGMVLYANKRDYAAAEPLFRDAVAMNRRLLGEDDQEVAATTFNLALLLRDKGQYAEAEALMRRAVAIDSKVLGESHPVVAEFVNGLATLLQRKGDYGAAELQFRRAIELYRREFPDDHWQIATIKSLLGGCLVATHHYNEAEPLLLESYPIIRANFGDSHNRTHVALKRIIDLYNAWGRPQKAAQYTAMLSK